MRISLNYKFLLKLGAGLALLNMVLNAAAVWLLFDNYTVISLWGPESLAALLLSNAGLAGLFFGYVVTRCTRTALRSGQVLPLHWHLKSQTMIDRMPSGAFHRSFIFGLCGALFAYLTLLLLQLQNRKALLFDEFLLLSSIQAALWGAGVTAMAFYRALGDEASTVNTMAASKSEAIL